MNLKLFLAGTISFLVAILALNTFPAYAVESAVVQTETSGLKYIGAALAFGTGAAGAGFAIAKAGSAGLAAATENIELKTQGVIIAALGEAIAIYGIVVALLILGA